MRVGRSLGLTVAACISVGACSRVEEPVPGPGSGARSAAGPTAIARPPILPGIPILTSPQDLQSAVGPAPISFGGEPTDAQVNELKAQLQLRTLPQLTAVPFTTTARTTDQQGRPVSGGHDPTLPLLKFIDIVPGGNTESGWMLLSVATVRDPRPDLPVASETQDGPLLRGGRAHHQNDRRLRPFANGADRSRDERSATARRGLRKYCSGHCFRPLRFLRSFRARWNRASRTTLHSDH
jgi:hypothetical protein